MPQDRYRLAYLSLGQIFRASMPWMIIQIAVVALLLFFPGLVTWLPNMMK